jgi:hypothetical protein
MAVWQLALNRRLLPPSYWTLQHEASFIRVGLKPAGVPPSRVEPRQSQVRDRIDLDFMAWGLLGDSRRERPRPNWRDVIMSCGSECLVLRAGKPSWAGPQRGEINSGEPRQMTKDAASFHGIAQIARNNLTEMVGSGFWG